MDHIPVNQYSYLQVNTIVAVANTSALTCNGMIDITISFKKAEGYITNKEFQKAIILIDEKIKQISNQYYSADIQDDTEMKLILANAEEKKGNLERAAYLKRNVLESRIQIFNNLNQCNKIINQTETAKYIGEALLEENGDILLQLFIGEDNSMNGQTLFRYKPNTEKYNAVLQHVGGLKLGEKKGVLPWPETK